MALQYGSETFILDLVSNEHIQCPLLENVDIIDWRRGVIKFGGLLRTVPLANGKSMDSDM